MENRSLPCKNAPRLTKRDYTLTELLVSRHPEFREARRRTIRYTLTELLVVMAVIMILMSILLPVFSRVRNHVKYTKWLARGYDLGNDPNVLVYSDFQEKSGYILENKSGYARGDVAAREAIIMDWYDVGPPGVWVPGATWTTGRWRTKGAVLFNGTDDWVNFNVLTNQGVEAIAPNPAKPGGDVSFEAWVWPTSVSAGRHQVISSDNANFDWSLLREGALWYVFTGTASVSTGFSVDLYQWQHLVAVWTKGKVRVYKNGVLAGTPPAPIPPSTGAAIGYEASVDIIGIASNPAGLVTGGIEFFAGKIDEVVVYDKALSDSDVQRSYEIGNLSF